MEALKLSKNNGARYSSLFEKERTRRRHEFATKTAKKGGIKNIGSFEREQYALLIGVNDVKDETDKNNRIKRQCIKDGREYLSYNSKNLYNL